MRENCALLCLCRHAGSLTLTPEPHNPRRPCLRATFIPPTTGNYTFWLSCDDNGKLFLSEDLESLLKVWCGSVLSKIPRPCRSRLTRVCESPPPFSLASLPPLP